MNCLHLAQEIRKCFRFRGLQGLLGFDENRRINILQELSKALNISSEMLGNGMTLAEYFLLEGQSISHKRGTGTITTIEPWRWLESIRNGEMPRYSILLPDEIVGPDLMFVLKKKVADSPADLILCFVQVSTQYCVLLGYTYCQERSRQALQNFTANHVLQL